MFVTLVRAHGHHLTLEWAAVRETARGLGLTVEPMHPHTGYGVVTNNRFYSVEVPDREAGERLSALVRANPSVDAVYIKPLDTVPGTGVDALTQALRRAEAAEKVIEVFRVWRRTPLDVNNSTAPWMKAESDAKRALREYDESLGLPVDNAW